MSIYKFRDGERRQGAGGFSKCEVMVGGGAASIEKMSSFPSEER
jgi:hypothetical protein